MSKLSDLEIKIFLDDANPETIINTATNPFFIEGFTTNPSLMAKAGITNYEKYAKSILESTEKPVSFEVFSDDFVEMERQARKIAGWAENVYVKIPIVNTAGRFSHQLIEKLSYDGIKCNVTAVFTADQVFAIEPCLCPDTPAIVSIFAGRIADTGRSPVPIIDESIWILERKPQVEVLWASCREIYNIFEANDIGADIITIPYNILSKINLIGKNLELYSKETVTEFYNSAKEMGFTL